MITNVRYRQQQPIMQELLRLYHEGNLTDDQALWFRETKPREELFDLENDPFELINLADSTEFLEKLAELRKACDDWVEHIEDTGLIPEEDLIDRIWPAGIQPATQNPEVVVENGLITIFQTQQFCIWIKNT